MNIRRPSPINTLASQDEKVTRTGTGVGGSEEADAGKVEKQVVQKGGHMLPFETPQECALLLALWLEKQIEDFQTVEKFIEEHVSGRSERNMLAVSEQWLKNVRMKPREKRIDKPNL